LRRLTSVVVAVLGIGMCADSLAFVAQVLSLIDMFGQPDYGPVLWSLVGAILTTGLTLAAGVFLIVRREWVAARLVCDDDELTIGPSDLLRLGLIVIGVWLVATSLPSLVAAISEWLYRAYVTARDQLDDSLTFETWSRATLVIRDLVQLSLGLLLLRRARVLSTRLWFGVERSDRAIEVERQADLPTCPHCGASYDPSEYVDLTTARCTECHQPLAG